MAVPDRRHQVAFDDSTKRTNGMNMKKNYHTLVLSLAAVGALGFAGCSSIMKDEGKGDRTAGRVADDNRVQGDVKSALKNSTIYKFDEVEVKTHNGIVQLSGWAATEEQKNKAGEIASRVEGVHEVYNNIGVKYTPTGRDNVYPMRPATNNLPKVDAPIKDSR
jgi:osmotically-inducible protein OsmY